MTTTRRIPSLDGLRAVSIAFVLLSHAVSHSANPWLNFQRKKTDVLSYLGVTIFFVISGFLITALLLREQEKNGYIDWRAFFRRRAFRIMPVALVYIAVVTLLVHPTKLQILYAASFTTSYFFDQAHIALQHLWSLSVEEQFYLLWPLVFSLGIRAAKRFCWFVMIACPIIRAICIHAGMPSLHVFPEIADSIAAGCLLAFYREPLTRFVNRYCLSNTAFGGIAFVTLACSYFLRRGILLCFWGITPCLIAIFILIAILRKDWFFNNGPAIALGVLSYSLYLWQQPFLALNGPLDFIPLRLLLALLVAILSYRFIEQPMLRFKSPRNPAVKEIPSSATP